MNSHFWMTHSLLGILYIVSQKCPKRPLKGLVLWASEVRECYTLLALFLPHFFSCVGSLSSLFNFGGKRFWKSFEDLMIWKEVQVGSHQWNNFLWNFLVNFVYMLTFSALLDWIALILAWSERFFLDDEVVLEHENSWWLHGGCKERGSARAV